MLHKYFIFRSNIVMIFFYTILYSYKNVCSRFFKIVITRINTNGIYPISYGIFVLKF